MTLSSATATPLPALGWLVLVGLAVLAAAVYAASCWWWPFARCWRCEGAGKFSRSDGRVWRPCRWCSGTGRRLRIGRWAYNYFRRVHDAA